MRFINLVVPLFMSAILFAQSNKIAVTTDDRPLNRMAQYQKEECESITTKLIENLLYFNMIGSFRPEAPVFRLSLSYNFNNYKNTSKTNDRVDINVGEGM